MVDDCEKREGFHGEFYQYEEDRNGGFGVVHHQFEEDKNGGFWCCAFSPDR